MMSYRTHSVEQAIQPGRAVLRNPYLWAFFVGIVCLTLIRPMLRRVPDPPPVFGELPAYRMIDSEGRAFGSEELSGRVYIANFMFTRCTSLGPRLTSAMGRLQDLLNESGIEDVRLVSFSVDPEYDTPERLRAYGESHDVDSRRWTFLTGERESMERLVVDGFQTPMGQPETTGSLVEIAHTRKLVLVDGRGRIRGYYDSDTEGIDEVFHRARHVLRDVGTEGDG